jgi:hypothetical protein
LDTILTNVFNEEAATQDYDLEVFLKAVLESFDFTIPKSLEGYAELNVKNIIYNKEQINNLKFNINYFDSEIYLDNCDMELPNQSFVKLNGFIEHNNIRPKFNGTTKIQINNVPYLLKWLNANTTYNLNTNTFVMESKVSFIPRTFRLTNFSILLDDKQYSGKYMLKNTGENKLYSKLTFKVDEFDLNALDIPRKLDNFISQLYLYDQDKSGQFFVNAIDDYKWLRRFPITLYLDITANKIFYKNIQFDKSNFLVRIAPNRIDLDKIDITSNYLNLSGFGQVRINIMTPEVNLDLNVKKIYYPILNLLFPTFDQLKQYRQNIYQQVTDKKLSINLPELETDIDFNFFSMQNFNTQFKIQIDQLIFDPVNIWTDIKTKGSIQDGVFILNSLTGTIFGGQVNIYGNTVFITQFPSFKYSFSLNNTDPSQLLGFTNNYKGIEGYLSIVGNFTTDGYSNRTFFSRMYGDTNFIGKKMRFSGFDVGEMITLTEADNILPSAKIDRLREAMSSGKSTFEDVQGKGIIKAGIIYFNNVSFSNNRVQGSYSAAYSMQDDLINGISRFSFIPQTPQNGLQSLMVETTNKGNLDHQDFKMDVSKISDLLSKQTQAQQKTVSPRNIFRH